MGLGVVLPTYCGNSTQTKLIPSYSGNTPVPSQAETQVDPDQVGGSGITAKVPALKSGMCLIKTFCIAGCP